MDNNRITRKAQVISVDLIFGIIIFMLILAGLISMFLFSGLTQKIDTYNYEMDYLYSNLEKNLGQLNNNVTFIHGSRIDAGRLMTFADEYRIDSIDDLVIGNVGTAAGIGLDPAAYDVCLYFTDNDKSIVQLHSIGSVGLVKAGTCNDVINQGKNPCEGYSDVVSMIKPVLYDEGNPGRDRIIQMNLVVCKI